MIGRSILVLVPHPDDEGVGCAAAIGRARAAGAAVALCYLSNGVPDRPLLWPWRRRRHPELVRRRWREAEEAARRLDVIDAGRLDRPTRTLKARLAEAEALISRVLAATRADTLWTPAYEGGHQDHDAANFLASRFSGRAAVWEFGEYSFAGGRLHGRSFPDTRGGERILTLTAEEGDAKRGLLAVYRSERANLGHIGTRFDRESFRPLPAHDYARPPHPGRQFYQRFQWVPWHPRIDRCRPQDVCAAIAEYARTAPRPAGDAEAPQGERPRRAAP